MTSGLEGIAASLTRQATTLSRLSETQLEESLDDEDRASDVNAVLGKTADRILQIRRDLSRLAALAVYSERSWPEQRQELQTKFDRSPVEGLTHWIGLVVGAAVRFELEALERLCSWEHPTMDGGALRLKQAGELTLAALSGRRYEVIGPLLPTVVASGLLAETAGLTGEHQGEAALLLARLAVNAGRLDDVGDWVEQADGLGVPDGETEAIVAWYSRAYGNSRVTKRHAPRTTSSGPALLATVVQGVAEALDDYSSADADRRRKLARRQAKDGVLALASLVGVEAELKRLVQPIPAEVWWAIGTRAKDEDSSLLALAAWNSADQAADNYSLRARIAEQQAKLHAELGHASEAAQYWRKAGNNQLLAGKTSGAVRSLTRALDYDGGDPESLVKLSDALYVSVFEEPEGRATETALRGLDAVDRARGSRGLDAETSWGYLVGSKLHTWLAERSPTYWDDQRAALRDAALAIAHAPIEARRWANLADAADNASLFRLGAFVVEVGSRLARSQADRSRFRAEAIRSAANLGDLDRARELIAALPDTESDFGLKAGAYVSLYSGDAPGSLQKVGEVSGFTPDESWLWEVMLRAALITDDPSLERYARSALGRLAGDNEFTSRKVQILAHLMLGDTRAAMSVTSDLVQIEAARSSDKSTPAVAYLGDTLLLRGNESEGLDHLAAYLSSFQSPRVNDGWANVGEPVLRRLASRLGRDLPALSELSSLARERAGLLAELDVLAEISEAELLRSGDGATADLREMLLAIVALGRGRADPILELVQGRALGLSRHESKSVERVVDRDASKLAAAVYAAKAVQSAEEGDQAAAQQHLRDAISRDSYNTNVYLTNAAPSDESQSVLAAALETLADEPEAPDGVEVVVNYLGWVSPTALESDQRPAPEPRVVMELPASWFDGYEDPVDSHPVFVEYLPRVRALAGRTIPAVHVVANKTPESSEYGISIDGGEVERGVANDSFRYASEAAVRLLDGEGRVEGASIGPGNLLPFEGASVEPGTLGALLTYPAQEAVVLRLIPLTSPAVGGEPARGATSRSLGAVGGRVAARVLGWFGGDDDQFGAE